MAKRKRVDPRVPTHRIEPGTPEMEGLLQAGYGMDIKRAQAIVEKAEGGDSTLLVSELYQKAKAMLEAFNARPVAVSTKPAWKPADE